MLMMHTNNTRWVWGMDVFVAEIKRLVIYYKIIKKDSNPRYNSHDITIGKNMSAYDLVTRRPSTETSGTSTPVRPPLDPILVGDQTITITVGTLCENATKVCHVLV